MTVKERRRAALDLERHATHRTHRRDRLALAVPPAVAAAATIGWFPFDRFLAAGDVVPFVRAGLSSELTAYWNHRGTGTGATTPVIGRVLEVAVIRVVAFFGGSEAIAQHVFYAVLMAFAAFGVAYLARAFVEEPLAVAAAGLLGVFNPFVLVRLPNPLTLVWLGLVAITAGTLIRVARGAPKSVFWFAACTIPAAYLSLNPPLLLTALVTVLAVAFGCSVLVGPGGARRASHFIARSLPWAIALNIWWVVPLVMSTLAREGVGVAAETRVEDWSWSHVQNSLAHVVSLTADWGWQYPEYAPYANGLDAAPVSWLRWILPMLAIAAPFFVMGRRRVATIGLLGAGIVGVFLAKGLHAPLEAWNLWLYHHVPGMWLLREPASKAGGLVVLVEVVLAAITLAALLRLIARHPLALRVSGLALLAVVVGLALAFPSPLWTGKFGSDGKHGLASAEVAIPSSWQALADTVNRSPVQGKLLELPIDSYYQVTTNWGYHGADEFTENLVNRPVLQLLPDGYLKPSGDVAAILRGTERALIEGKTTRARNLLRILNVSHVIVRHDLTDSQVVRTIGDPERIGAGLAALPEMGEPRAFGVADLYTVTGGADLAWIPDTVVGLARQNADRRVDSLATLPPGTVAVPLDSVPLDTMSWEVPSKREAAVRFELRKSGTYAVGLSGEDPTRWRARVRTNKGASRLELSDPLRVELDGKLIPSATPMVVPIFGNEVLAVELGDQRFVLDGSQAIALPVAGSTKARAFAQSSPPAVKVPAAVAGTCGPSVVDQAAAKIPRGVAIRSGGGLVCATVPGPTLSPEGLYRVRVQIRTPEGEPSRFLCLWQYGPESCATIDQPPTMRNWSTFDAVVQTDSDATGLSLYLYADAPVGAPVEVQYRDVTITPLRVVGASTIVPQVRRLARWNLERGKHILRASQPDAGVALRADSPLGDCNKIDERSAKEAGLGVRSIPRGVEVKATEHSACVQAVIPRPDTDAGYTLALDVRTVSGSRARICVWQDGPNRCARTRTLPGDSAWNSYTTTFRLDPGTTSARVYLYADGNSLTRTVTQYRDLELRSLSPSIVEISAAGGRSTPTVSWDQASPDTVSVAIDRPSRDQVVVLNEAYGSGWQLAGVKSERHVVANGYANAWLVSAPGAARFQAEYGPSRLAHLALVGSILAAIVAGAVALLRKLRPPAVIDTADDPRLEVIADDLSL